MDSSCEPEKDANKSLSSDISNVTIKIWWDDLANILRSCYTPYRVDLDLGSAEGLQDWTIASAAEGLSTLDPKTKELIVGFISCNEIGIRILFMNMQELALTGTKKAEHLSKVMREIVNPRNNKLRSVIIRQTLATDYLETLISILKDLLFIRSRAKVQKEHACVDSTIANLLWFLSAVGTNDSGFASKVRKMLKVKFFHHDIFKKFFFAKSSCHYPLLKILRQLARNESASKTLGKDSVMTTIRKCFAFLPNMPGQKLQILLDILSHLTKDKTNCHRFIKIGMIGKVLRCFSMWEKWRGKGLLKMIKNIINIYNRIARIKSGRKTLIQSDAINQIRKFCDNCPSEKSFTDIIMRCAAMIATCYDKDTLPIDVLESPVDFKLPENGQMSRCQDSGSSSDDEGSESGTDSEKEDDADEGDENASDEESDSNVDSEKSISDESDEEEVGSKNAKHPTNSTKDYEIYNKTPVRKSSIVQTNSIQSSVSEKAFVTTEKLIKYNRYFQEFGNQLNCNPMMTQTQTLRQMKLGMISPNAGFGDSSVTLDENCNETRKTKHIPRSDHKYSWLSDIKDCNYTYWSSMDELRAQYSNFANAINHVTPFVKIAYPDFSLGYSRKASESMLPSADRSVLRNKIIAYMTRLVGGDFYKPRTVYSLDDLLNKNDSENNFSGPLRNYDEKESGKYDKKSGLQFEARFESGNLRKAIQIGDREFDLLITSDVNTRHHNQWFYFQVSNTQNDKAYTFNIINCTKANSSFNYGMQPVVFSVADALRGKPGWIRSGSDICYYKNGYKRISKKRQNIIVYHTASFNINFAHKGDVVYIAYHMPFTYTRLLVELNSMVKAVESRDDILVKYDSLCLTLNKNEVPVLTIASSDRSLDNRKIIFLTSRVHPGETNASWVMKGILEYLIFGKNNRDLFKKYIFKIVPMLNVEGVINGCHRCGLTTEDLNRCWKSPSEILHPEIYHSKVLIEYCCTVLKSPPVIYCDLHGHSRRKNVFFYGCSLAKSWNAQDKLETEDSSSFLALPESMDNVSSAFSLTTCKYDVTKGRETTARVAVWRDYKIMRSYTLECSYCGCDRGPYKGTSFGTNQLLEIGKDLCNSFLELSKDE